MVELFDYATMVASLMMVDRLFRGVLCKPAKFLIGLYIGNDMIRFYRSKNIKL